jgi:hypothetical protein
MLQGGHIMITLTTWKTTVEAITCSIKAITSEGWELTALEEIPST